MIDIAESNLRLSRACKILYDLPAYRDCHPSAPRVFNMQYWHQCVVGHLMYDPFFIQRGLCRSWNTMGNQPQLCGTILGCTLYDGSVELLGEFFGITPTQTRFIFFGDYLTSPREIGHYISIILQNRKVVEGSSLEVPDFETIASS